MQIIIDGALFRPLKPGNFDWQRACLFEVLVVPTSESFQELTEEAGGGMRLVCRVVMEGALGVPCCPVLCRRRGAGAGSERGRVGAQA